MYTFTIMFNGIWTAIMLTEKSQNPAFDAVTMMAIALLAAVLIIQHCERDYSNNVLPTSEYWQYLACGSNKKYILYSNILSCILFCTLFGITVLEIKRIIPFSVGTVIEILVIPTVICWLNLFISRIPKDPTYVLNYVNKYKIDISLLSKEYSEAITITDEIRYGYDYVFIGNKVMRVYDIESCDIVRCIDLKHPFCFYLMRLKTKEDTIEVYSFTSKQLYRLKRMIGK